MKVTLERAALLKSLGHVHRVVERRTTIPVLSNVLIEATGRKLSLRASALDLEVSESIAGDVGRDGTTTLPAHTLYDIVRDVAADTGAGLSFLKRRSRSLEEVFLQESSLER